MILPTPYTAGHRAAPDPSQPVTRNAYGDPITEHVWQPPIPIHWGAPGAMADLNRPNRDATRIEWTLCTPAPCPVGPRDLIVWQGVEYAVNGTPKDWTLGPVRNPVAAVLIELTKTEG